VNYSALAPLYDRIMAHVEYNQWLKLIMKITSKYFTHNKPTILELGGGTGTLGIMLIENGFPYCGSDFSPGMCNEALKKGLPFICADARDVPLKKTFSLIIFLYDGINYFKTLQEYTRLFLEMHSRLDANGCFLFDITTETNSKTNFIDFIDAEDFGDSSYARHSYYNKKQKTQHNVFTIYLQHAERKTFYTKHRESHTQRIFSIKEILSALPDTHFNVLGIWDNFSFERYTHRSERIHFLIQKISRL